MARLTGLSSIAASAIPGDGGAYSCYSASTTTRKTTTAQMMKCHGGPNEMSFFVWRATFAYDTKSIVLFYLCSVPYIQYFRPRIRLKIYLRISFVEWPEKNDLVFLSRSRSRSRRHSFLRYVSQKEQKSLCHTPRFALRNLLLFTFFCTWPGPKTGVKNTYMQWLLRL